MNPNSENTLNDSLGSGDGSGAGTPDPKQTARKRQRVRLTREEMQAIGERRRNYERISAEEIEKSEDPRPAQRRAWSAATETAPAAPSYRDRYNAEHADGDPRTRNYSAAQGRRAFRKPAGEAADEQRGNAYGGQPQEGRKKFNSRNPKSNDQKRPNSQKPGAKADKPKGQKTQKKGPQKVVKQRPHYTFREEAGQSSESAVRLNKYLAHAGVASRREADDLIRAGAVVINGVPVLELGTKVLPGDRVEINGKVVAAEEKVYILLNKPRNVVTTTEDPQERMTVLNLVRSAASERIYPVGRLDRNTTGVLLLTNDGDLAAKLVHPSYKKKKIYQVWLDKEVVPEDMQKLADGIELSDGEMHADAISYVDEEDHTQVGIEIHSGKNRVVRRLFEALGYRVLKLDRVYFAGLTKKNLGRGKWRYLTEQEVVNLKNGFFE